jgi:hypothetical protein
VVLLREVPRPPLEADPVGVDLLPVGLEPVVHAQVVNLGDPGDQAGREHARDDERQSDDDRGGVDRGQERSPSRRCDEAQQQGQREGGDEERGWPAKQDGV